MTDKASDAVVEHGVLHIIQRGSQAMTSPHQPVPPSQTQEAMRKEFEDEVLKRGNFDLSKTSSGVYHDSDVQNGWWGFQLGRNTTPPSATEARRDDEALLLWQPIETAPDNDDYVLLWCGFPAIGCKATRKPKRGGSDWYSEQALINPIFHVTHWMPLPPPIKESRRD